MSQARQIFPRGVLGSPRTRRRGSRWSRGVTGWRCVGRPARRRRGTTRCSRGEPAPRTLKVVPWASHSPGSRSSTEDRRPGSADKLGAEQDFRRVPGERAGASGWRDPAGRDRPTRRRDGPDGAYAWDQTPTEVEVTVPAPPGTTPKQVSDGLPRRLEIRLRVPRRCGARSRRGVREDGTSSGSCATRGTREKELFMTMEKRLRDVGATTRRSNGTASSEAGTRGWIRRT